MFHVNPHISHMPPACGLRTLKRMKCCSACKIANSVDSDQSALQTLVFCFFLFFFYKRLFERVFQSIYTAISKRGGDGDEMR